MKAFPPLSLPILTLGLAIAGPAAVVRAAPHNVLFITVDDFRPELPAYGATHIQAPNMDRLSDGGLTFSRAYVQQAICQPARDCVLTGARPDTTRIYNVFESATPTFRTTMGAVATLPSVFKDNGYWTAGYGKNFHHVDNPSWTESNTFYTTADLYQDPANRAIASDPNTRPPVENYAAGVEADYMDAKVAAAAAAAIRARAADGQKFFIAAGFWKPHLPFTAPKAYWDMYDRNTLPIATGPDALPVQGSLPLDLYDPYSGELATYKGGRPPFVAQTAATQAALANGTFTTNQQTGPDWGIITVNSTHIYPEDYARELTHGYYACTSFVDAQIGKLLAALEDPNNDGNTSDSILDATIVVLWGDHGFHLGRHGSWPKHTNLDSATRIPFIIHHPDMPAGTQGQMTDALMESVDIMPTLLEMANLPAPTTHTLEGRSLAPLLADPNQTWKTAAFSQYPKESPMGSGIWYMGYTMRTATHSYVQWRTMQATDANPISLANRNFTVTNTIAYEELYDMVNDPKQNVNIGNTPAVRPLRDACKSLVTTALSSGYANTQQVGSTTPTAPQAQAVAFTGNTSVGDTLTAHYLFADANGDANQNSTVEWVRADTFAGPFTSVVGTGATYTLQAADEGKYVKLRVTPQADAAPATGAAVLSDTAIVAGTGFDDGSTQPAPESSIYEGFDYNAGGLSSSSAGGTGWSGGWFGDAALTFGANSGAAAADKTWSVPTGYTYTPAGRAATNNSANGNTPFRRIDSDVTIDTASETAYFSFFFKHDSSAMFECRFYAGTTEVTKLQVDTTGQLRLNGATYVPTGFTLTAGEDYLLVGKITGNASGNDTLQVSVFPASGSIPDAEPTFSYSVNFSSSAVLDRVMFGIPGSTAPVSTFWDEFRLGTTWRSVLGTVPGGGTSPPTGTAPVASLVGVSGTRNTGDLLLGHYTYSDAESNAESGSTFRWLSASTANGSYAAISGATAQTYTLQSADQGKYLKFEVTPKNQAATEPTGLPVLSAPVFIGSNLTYGLQSHIEFEDANLSAGLADSSGNNKGAASATGTLIARGSGKALQLNGTSDRFTLPFDGTIFNDGLSVAFWANGDAASMPKNSALAWAIKTTGGNQDNLLLAPGYNNARLMVARMGHNGTSHEESTYTAASADTEGNWTHWAFVKNIPAGTIEVYKNGALVDTATNKQAPVYVQDHWKTGGGWVVGEVWDAYYAGAIDDYRIYDRQITGSEVSQIYNIFSPTPVASSISVVSNTGNLTVGGTLTASYTFTYSNGTEGTSTFQWYRADSENGTYAAIAGATSATYTSVSADADKWLRFGVTPIGQDLVAGPEVFSTALAIIAAGGGTPAPEPILHLTFDSANLADSSPASLAVTGTPTFATADGRSYAVFNGISNTITVPMLRSFPNGLTIALWTLAQDGTDGMPKNTALGWARQNGGDGTVIAPGYNNTNKHIFRAGRTTINDEVSTGAPITGYLNTWVHWAVTKDPVAGTMKLYRDGVEVGSSTGKTIVPEFVSDSNTGGATGGFRIGTFWGAYYKGFLDDYRIYETALTPEQVQTIYQQSAASEPTAFNLAVSGTPAQVGSALTASYEYAGGTQGTSTFQWFRSGLATGPWVEIAGATALSFTPTSAEDGGYVRFRVIPKNAAGVSGEAVWSLPLLVGAFVDRSLANTVRRIQSDHALNVVFLGGSITDGVGQSNGLPYSTRIMNWLQTTYPTTTFHFTNAAISGTGSEFGVYRTDRHVLAHNPDLVFIEYAVNDSEQEQVNWTYIYPNERLRATMEGIVRKIRAARPSCDIVFLYTTTVAMAQNSYENSQLPPKTAVHKEVADHHGIPQIDLAQALVTHKQSTGYPYRIDYGEPGAFSPTANHYLPDYVHPSNLGHQVYGDAAQAALATYFNIPTPAALVNHPVPTPLSPTDLTGARILDHNDPAVTYGSGWTPTTLSISTTGTEEFQTTASASTVGSVSVAFAGGELGVYYKRSSTSGQIAWSTDSASGEKSFNDTNFSAPGFTSFAMLSTSLSAGSHMATITPQAIDTNESLAIAGWLVLGEAPARTPGPIRILALGDSITYGLSFGEANGQTAFPCGYRGPLQNLLQADPDFTNNFEFVGLQKSTNTNAPGTFDKSKATSDLLRYDGHHQGHPSYTIQNMYAGNSTPPPGNLYDELVNNYTAETFDPDIVLLHIGINDIIAQSATAASIQDDYRALVSKIYEFQPGADLYISTIMINHPNHPNYAEVSAFNTYLTTVELPYWQAQGKSIHLVDMFAALQGSGYSSTLPSTNVNYGTTVSPDDRTHPNHTGYANMAAAWKAAMSRPALVSAPGITPTLWADSKFASLAGGSAHPDAALTADPDGDGIANLLEFALGGNPLQSGAGILPVIGTSTNRLTLEFTPDQTTGLRYLVEASSDLSDWSDASDITSLLQPGVPYLHTDAADLSAGTPRRFLRLRVTAP